MARCTNCQYKFKRTTRCQCCNTWERQDVSELWRETIHVSKVAILSITREYQSIVRPVLAIFDSVERPGRIHDISCRLPQFHETFS